MRRSQAIETIKEALRKWNGAYYDESLESFILSELEELGMLPPLIKVQTSDIFEEPFYNFKNRWELEED